MRRLPADPAKIVGGFDKAGSKVLLPNPVNDAPPGELVPGVDHPIGKRDATIPFRMGLGKIEGIHALDNSGHRCGTDLTKRAGDITAIQNANLPWLPVHMTTTNEIPFSMMNGRHIGTVEFG